MENINVHATVASNSLKYFEYMCDNYKKLATSCNVRFFAHVIDGTTSFKSDVIVFRATAGVGSTGHGHGVTSAMQHLVPDEINVISDCDMAFLMRGWDARVVELLKTYDIFGTTFEKIGGYCSGNGLLQTHKDIPNISWFALPARSLDTFRTANMQPLKQIPLPITTPELSKMYGLPVGYQLLRDTGWEIPKVIYETNMSYKSLYHARPTTDAIVVKTGSDYNEEYQLDGVPFLAHQRGSMKHRFWQDPLSKNFYDIVDTHVKSLIG
jgi:hypothetical protein